MWVIYPVSGGSGEDEPVVADAAGAASGDGSSEPAASGDGAGGSEPVGVVEPVAGDDAAGSSDDDNPAPYDPREEIAWLRSELEKGGPRMEALETRLASLEASPTSRRRRSAAPSRTQITVTEPAAPTERPAPAVKTRKTKRVKWGRKTPSN